MWLTGDRNVMKANQKVNFWYSYITPHSKESLYCITGLKYILPVIPFYFLMKFWMNYLFWYFYLNDLKYLFHYIFPAYLILSKENTKMQHVPGTQPQWMWMNESSCLKQSNQSPQGGSVTCLQTLSKKSNFLPLLPLHIDFLWWDIFNEHTTKTIWMS